MKYSILAFTAALLSADAFSPASFGLRAPMQLQSAATETKAFPKLPASVKVCLRGLICVIGWYDFVCCLFFVYGICIRGHLCIFYAYMYWLAGKYDNLLFFVATRTNKLGTF